MNQLEISNQVEVIKHPILEACKLPSEGRLKWLGGNIGLAYPVNEDVLDDKGNIHFMGLKELLDCIDSFEGYRSNTPIKENILDRCFSAYEYNLLSESERHVFEDYVSANISKISQSDAARILMLNK